MAADGDRVKILGEDISGKTSGLEAVQVLPGESFSDIAGKANANFTALLIAPMMANSDEEAEILSKNNSSVVMRLTLESGDGGAAKYLFGGDAEVAIWERIYDRVDPADLRYDVLIAPHHCSWHSLSWDSWSELREKARVSAKAREALGQAEVGATVISSSSAIKDDDNDPPCIRAKREYESILKSRRGEFRCLADEAGDEPFEVTISRFGPRPTRRRGLAAITGAGGTVYTTGVGAQPIGHGRK
jgi:hypothetical protein